MIKKQRSIIQRVLLAVQRQGGLEAQETGVSHFGEKCQINVSFGAPTENFANGGGECPKMTCAKRGRGQ